MRTGSLRSSVLRGVWSIALAALVLLSAAACSAPAEVDETEIEPVVTEAQYALLDDMTIHAERAYKSIVDGDVEDARNRMVQLSVAATKLSYDGLASIEGMEALSESVSEALQSLNSLQPDEHESLLTVIRVRLAVDALKHPSRPIWLDFQKQVSDDIKELSQAVNKHDADMASTAMKKWKAHVMLIRPAVVISKDASEAKKLDSITAFLENHLEKREWGKLEQGMPNIVQALDELFRSDSEQRETFSPFTTIDEPPHTILWSLAIGSIIVAVLTYVAWRRYQFESAYVRVKDERDFDGGL